MCLVRFVNLDQGNRDLKDHIKVGAGATILPGVRIGKYAIVGASSVVTKDIPDYAVAVGSPAKVVKYLDPKRFED